MQNPHKQSIPVGDNAALDDYVRQIEQMGLPVLLAVSRIARLTDMAPRRVYELVEHGDLAAVRCGRRRIRVFRESFLDWLRGKGSV